MKLFLILFVFLFSGGYFVSGQAAQGEKSLWQPYFAAPRSGSQHIDLSGTWILSHRDTSAVNREELRDRKDPFETTIPNSVHWSYYNAGKLPHPYAHLNSTRYRWIEEKAWYYEKEVVIPASAKGSNLLLCFDGIDYFSRIWVNDSLIGVHEGMFGGPVVDINSMVRYGAKNSILVEVRAANWGNRSPDVEGLPRTASGEFDYSKRTGFNPRKSGRITKPWVLTGGSGTEAFFVLGMWQGARIEIIPPVHLERPYLTTKSASSESATLHLSVELLAQTNSLMPEGNRMYRSKVSMLFAYSFCTKEKRWNERSFPWPSLRERTGWRRI
jgi:beta-mannosidase